MAYIKVMTIAVQKLTEQVKSLPHKELDEFLSWLADYELQQEDDWDREIERDSQPGGKLDAVLQRVRRDVAEGRTKPLNEVLDDA